MPRSRAKKNPVSRAGTQAAHFRNVHHTSASVQSLVIAPTNPNIYSPWRTRIFCSFFWL